MLASFAEQKERSKFQWELDLSLLTQEPYSIVLKKTTTRIFEVKKYKKKPKKKPANGVKKIHPKAKIAAALKPKAAKNKRPPKK